MSKNDKSDDYAAELVALQTELVKAQAWAIGAGQKMLIVFEGRDAAGKDGTIRRVIEHQSPRNMQVVALPKPSDIERTQWYFQRYIPYLPAAGEWVIFNRSWYNRAGVEPVMGFCTAAEHERFLTDVPAFEQMLVEADIKLVKLWMDISKTEQAERLDERRKDPLKLLKTSPLDAEAQKRWDAYSAARNEMLTRTHTDFAPWVCVRNDHKKRGRLNVLRHLLRVIDAPGLSKKIAKPDPKVLFTFEPAAITDGRLEI
jgi:polyphosphate kinase 2